MRRLLTPDAGAEALTNLVRSQRAFLFFRYGDGAIECMNGIGRGTCDGEKYTPVLGTELKRCWDAAVPSPRTYVGDWLSASFDADTKESTYEKLYGNLVNGHTIQWVHFESLLFMRDSEVLMDFYVSVARDPRKKLLVGPAEHLGAAKLMRADFYGIPMTDDLFSMVAKIREDLIERKFDILLYGAGMAGNVAAIDCWRTHQDRTYINLGSAFDPLFRCRSRKQQLPREKIATMFRARGFVF